MLPRAPIFSRRPFGFMWAPLVAGMVLLGVTGSARADTHTWTGAGGDNNWSTAANWNIGAPIAGDRLLFTGAATPSNNDFAAGTTFTLQFNAGATGYNWTGNGITLGNSGTSDLRHSGTGNNTISFDVNQAQRDWRVDTGRTLTMAGIITGGNVNMRGGGTLVLQNAANAFTGLRIGIDAGGSTAQVHTGAFGTGVIRFGWGGGNQTKATLEYVGTGETIGNRFQIGQQNTGNVGHTAGGTITNNGTGTLILSNSTFNNNVNVAATRTVEFNGISDIEVQGTIQDNAGTNGAGLINLIKSDSNTLTLTGTSTYTGTTTVDDGILQVGVAGAGSITSVTTVNSGGTLAGTGTIDADATITSGGNLSPGDSEGTDIGTLDITGILDLQAGSLTTFGINTSTDIDPATAALDANVVATVNALAGTAYPQADTDNEYDQIVANTVNLTAGGTILVSPLSFAPVKGMIYQLFNSATINQGSFAVGDRYRSGSQNAGYDLKLPNLSSASPSYRWDTSLFISDGILIIVPEPSRALLLLIGLSTFIIRRQR